VLLERLNAWAANLEADGLALAPVSALVQAPPPDDGHPTDRPE
jgi:hypothetical protein